jgi:hypothetical protein
VKQLHKCIPYNFLPTRSATTTTIQLSCSRPPFNPSRSHPSKRLFNVLPGLLLPFCLYFFIVLGNLFTTRNSVYMLHPISYVVLNFVSEWNHTIPFAICVLFYKLSKCILIYFISAAVILLVSLAAIGQLSLSHNKAGRASVLHSVILFCLTLKGPP